MPVCWGQVGQLSHETEPESLQRNRHQRPPPAPQITLCVFLLKWTWGGGYWSGVGTEPVPSPMSVHPRGLVVAPWPFGDPTGFYTDV